MSRYVKLLHSDIDTEKMLSEVLPIVEEHDEIVQLCISSPSGENDFASGQARVQHAHKWNKINTVFKDSYTEQILNRYSKYYRWRVMSLDEGKPLYTVHRDGGKLTRNFRIHIPLVTNSQCGMVFFNTQEPFKKFKTECKIYNLKAGNSYLVNTSNYHTAFNFGFTDGARIHIVGEYSYER